MTPEARRWPFYSEGTSRRVADLVAEGRVYASGPDPLIAELESRFAQLHRPGGHALFFGSGTAALLASYFALGIRRGAEVIAPTNTFRATVTPLLPLGLRPVLCDADPATGNLDLSHAESLVSKRTEAIVVTHLWGHPLNLTAVRRFADRHRIALIEDASHAHGSHWRGQPVGTVGDTAVFSMGTKKLVSGGMGGMLLTSDVGILERAALLGHPKEVVQRRSPPHSAIHELARVGLGFNLRGTPIAALLALDHLDRLPHTVSVKNENHARLRDILEQTLPLLRFPERDPDFTSGTFYALRATWAGDRAEAERVRRQLVAAGVPVERQGVPLHRRPELQSGELAARFGWGEPSPPTAPASERTWRADELYDRIIGWDTRELYEPAEEVLDIWRTGIEQVARTISTQITNRPQQ